VSQRWRRFRGEAALFAAVFAATVLAGLGVVYWPFMHEWVGDTHPGFLLAVAAAAFAIPAYCWWWGWHLVSNVFATHEPRPLARPWVIDGDTIDDLATGVRYRLANIDAPETGDNAKCYKEAERGQLAKWTAVRLIREAARVTTRPTWRKDRYGRRVAFVLIDGEDLGELLVQRGLAVRWQGHRKKWCGANGGLAKIAARGRLPHQCRKCRRWR
jgi:endonuclease YncB( thermonuclease family)